VGAPAGGSRESEGGRREAAHSGQPSQFERYREAELLDASRLTGARSGCYGARGGLQAFVGMFASRTGDLAVRHDDYLYTWKKPAS